MPGTFIPDAFIVGILWLGAFVTGTLSLLLMVALWRASAARDAVDELERRLLELERRHRSEATPPAEAAAADSPAAAVPPTAAVSPDAAVPPSAAARAAAPSPAAASPATPAATAPVARAAPLSLEALIGRRWMLYVGIATLTIGIGLFVRYAFANQWITESLRVAIGALSGTLVIVAGHRFAARGHARFGATLVGGGIAILYLSVYAALNLYRLVNPATGFVLLVSVTALAAMQADRLRAQPLAMAAVIGGFATPFLVGGADSLPQVFSYTAILIAVVVYLAHRRDWPALNLVSFVLTGVTVLLWNIRLYRSEMYLTTELFFTLFAALFFWVLARMSGSAHPHARWVRLALWTTPAWYHLASLSILLDGQHWLAFLVYLIAATGAGVAFAGRLDARWSRLLLWMAVAAPLLDWTNDLPGDSWILPAAMTWVAVTTIHVAAQIELIRRVGAWLHPADVLLLPANGIGLCFGLYAALEPDRFGLAGLVAAGLAVAYGGLTKVLDRMDTRAARHTLAVAVSLAMAAVAAQLDGDWASVLWAAQAGGWIRIGIQERRPWMHGGGVVLLVVATIRLLGLQFAPLPAVYTVLLNQRALLGFFVVAALCYAAWLHARAADGAHRSAARIAAAVVAANLLMLVTLSTEISAFWELRARMAPNAELIRQMMLSATWGAYAVALTAAGIKRRYAPVRYLAIAVFLVTVVKLFTVDFSQLDSVYRIVSSIALGVLLVGASYLYQVYGSRLTAGTEALPPDRPADGS